MQRNHQTAHNSMVTRVKEVLLIRQWLRKCWGITTAFSCTSSNNRCQPALRGGQRPVKSADAQVRARSSTLTWAAAHGADEWACRPARHHPEFFHRPRDPGCGCTSRQILQPSRAGRHRKKKSGLGRESVSQSPTSGTANRKVARSSDKPRWLPGKANFLGACCIHILQSVLQ